MRKGLREVIKKERKGELVIYQSVDGASIAGELKICEQKLSETNKLLGDFDGSINAQKKILTKITHVRRRVERLNPSVESEIQRRNQLLTTVILYNSELINNNSFGFGN